MHQSRKANSSIVDRRKDQVVLALNNETLTLSSITPRVLRVRCTCEANLSDQPGVIRVPNTEAGGQFDINVTPETFTIAHDSIQVDIDRASGAVTFRHQDVVLLREPVAHPRRFEPIEIKEVSFDLESAEIIKSVDGERITANMQETGDAVRAWTVQQHFEWAEGEALYGLGSHEENVLNLRGTMQYLYQHNTKAVVPVLLSSRGYGLLFDATCEMEFHDDGKGSFIKLDAVHELDYYVIYGPNFDDIIAGYRELTGRAPMLPRWAFGYCQSKERYASQAELIDVLEEYRRRQLPIDLIIQDWKYWPTGWGIKEFDAERFPDPTGMCRRVHELNAHIMLSIWPAVSGDHPEPKRMQEMGWMLPDQHNYDAYSEEARAEYWKFANDNLFRHGIDAWWCDCTEPGQADWNGETKPSPKMRRDLNIAALRSLLGRARVNSYSLHHSQGIYENQRSTSEEKRVLNLTRSAYAGQQRYATVTWSGDIAARWDVLEQQVAAGLSFTATGCPYWTNDIGAFFVKNKKDAWFWSGQFEEGCHDPGYRELYTRWFQYGAFMPMFRSHGTDTPREVWRFGEPGEIFYETLKSFLELRYRLLPYIYSLAGQVTQKHGTMMRALAFDFRTDSAALNIKDQYMFGPALLVCPVTHPMYYGPDSAPLSDVPKSRSVYLPAGTEWYDFWTGTRYAGGQTVTAAAPLDIMPLFVRAGSIIPMGPDVQYADEKLNADWTIHVYPGADGRFTIYEDSGDGYGYEHGEFATRELTWDDASRQLTIGEQQGRFPGMSTDRVMKVTVIDEALA